MEKYFLPNDVNLICVTAESFPDGVMGAFDALGKILSLNEQRSLYGISFPNGNNKIIYKAGAEELYKGEAEEKGCEPFTILKGNYISTVINDFMNNPDSIGRTFNELISNPSIDPAGCCVEMYINNKDVRCMVRLNPEKAHIETLAIDLDSAFNELIELLSSVSENKFNVIPPKGGWTAGQLGRHVIKSGLSFVQLLNGPFENSGREADKHVGILKESFLNFDIRMSSPEFIVPEVMDYNKDELVSTLESINAKFIKAVHTKDLNKIYTAFELPHIGYLSGLECAYFTLYHTQRHVHQLKNIIKDLNNTHS